MKNFKIKITLAMSLFIMTFVSHSAIVAVVGSQSQLNTIEQAFVDAGDTVIRVSQSWNGINEAQLDEIFAADIIWESDVFAAINANVQNRLIDFVNDDRGLMLTAERICCETSNASIQSIGRTLTDDVNLIVGGLGTDLFGHNFSNSPTTILTGPNDIRGQVVQMDGPGQVMPTGGVNSNACFVSSGNNRDFCTAAAWGADELVNSVGRMIIYGDINSQPGLVQQFQGQQFENMREFLLSGLSGGGDVCIQNPNLPGCEEIVTPVNAPASLGIFSLLMVMLGSFYRRKRA